MQELYALMWLINATKGMMRISGEEMRETLSKANRKPASPYPYNNTEWAWDKAHSLN